MAPLPVLDISRNDQQSLLLAYGLPKEIPGDSALLRVFMGDSALHDLGA